jgi:hypothetical protein
MSKCQACYKEVDRLYLIKSNFAILDLCLACHQAIWNAALAKVFEIKDVAEWQGRRRDS